MHLATMATEAVIAVQKEGGCAVLMVLTVPHKVTDDVARLWRVWLRQAWSHMTHRAAWREWQARWGVEDWCAGTEVTHSLATGHHPHDNVVLLAPGRATFTPDELDVMQGQLWRMWSEALAAVGCDRPVSVDHGAVLRLVDDAEALGGYVFKHVGLEFSAPAGLKEGRAEGSVECRDLPLLLADECKGERVRDVAVRDRMVRRRVEAWHAYRQAANGQQMFRASEGFYRWTGAERMTVAEMRAQAGRLQREDRVRLAKALGQEVSAKADIRAAGDGVEEDAPPVAWMNDEGFHESRGSYEDPQARGSGVIVLEAMQARRQGIAFHAYVSSLIRRYGPVKAAGLVVAGMGRPAQVWRDPRGTIIVSYRQDDPSWQPVTEFEEVAA